MKIITWNVNGWRSMLKNDHFKNLMNKEDPDIVCLQETKLNKSTHIDFKGYKVFENTAEKPGYSGTAILYKDTISFKGFKKNRSEGRICMMEFEDFSLLNVYTPNSGDKTKRLDYRINYWDKTFLERIKEIHKNIIIVGDLNVARTEKDLKHPNSNKKNAGFTVEERNSFENILKKRKLKDVWREQNPEKEQYTFWSNFNNARKNNAGWRIDYVLTDHVNIKNCKILDQVMGSDHAPIVFEIITSLKI